MPPAVSLSKSAIVIITLPDPAVDIIRPALAISTLANGSYTNNATLNISGRSRDLGGLKSVSVNGQIVTVNHDGTFAVALPLDVGSNFIKVVATDLAGNRTSRSRTVVYDPNAPVLTIDSPADNSRTAKSFITINGTVSEASTVAVATNDGTPHSAEISGSVFSTVIYLAPGINTVSLTTGSATLILKGTVVDTLSQVTIRIIMDGKTYAPVVTNGTFQQLLTLTTAKQYAVAIMARDAAGHRTTIYRNVIYRPETQTTPIVE